MSRKRRARRPVIEVAPLDLWTNWSTLMPLLRAYAQLSQARAIARR